MDESVIGKFRFTTKHKDIIFDLSEMVGISSPTMWEDGEVKYCAQLYLRDGRNIDLCLRDYHELVLTIDAQRRKQS